MARTLIIDNIWLGRWKDAEECRKLTGWKVLTLGKEAKVIGDWFFPVSDLGNEPDDFKHFEKAIEQLERIAGHDGQVLVHCQSGVNCGPAILIAYLMRLFGGYQANAFNYVKIKRKYMRPSDAQLEFALMANGMNGPVDRTGFETPEMSPAEIVVDALYQKILGRSADPDGLDHYSEEIAQGNLSATDVETILRKSSEARK